VMLPEGSAGPAVDQGPAPDQPAPDLGAERAADQAADQAADHGPGDDHGADQAVDQAAGEGAGPSRRSALAKLAGKAGWNLGDQMLSTLTNAVLAVLVTHQDHGGSAAGAFSAAFLIFSFAIAVERALTGQVLTIRYSAAGDDEWPGIASRALGTVAVLAAPAGGAMIVAGLLFGGELRWPLIAVGVTLVPMLLQDTIRGVFFAQSRADLAALNDAVWAVVQFSVMGVIIAGGWATAGSLTFAWGASATCGVVLGAVQLRAGLHLNAARAWVRAHGDLLGYLLPETLITSGGAYVAFLAIGTIIDLSALGAVSYARQILGPLMILGAATASFAMPEVARRVHLSARVRYLLGVGIAVMTAVASLAYVGIVMLVPDSIGTAVFHDTWTGARAVLLPMGLFSALAGACLGPFMVIAAMGHAKRTFRLTVLQTVLTVTLMPLGAVLYGTGGAAWFLVLAKVIELPFWFVTLRTASHLGPVVVAEDGADELGEVALADSAAPQAVA